MNIKALLISSAIILTTCSCSPSESGKKPEGVLTNAQEKTLQKAEQMDDMSKAIDDKRLKDLNEAEGQKSEEK